MRAVYPGSFDPVTNGHVDIIERAARVFDEVIVAVAPNRGKEPLFCIQERMEMLSEVCAHLKNVSVDSFEGLLVSYAERRQAGVIVRGLRAVSDFPYEFEMALMNRRLNPSIETVFLMTGAENAYLSSSVVKEVTALGGSIDGLAPDLVVERLRLKLQEEVRESEP
ncbi:MAG: pantetheine-phosphate adenylyltransferase [Armatimonadota bacterium]|nr:pantetheine-phosphate adenylyltransferase [Armatimonadota bacterium]